MVAMRGAQGQERQQQPGGRTGIPVAYCKIRATRICNTNNGSSREQQIKKGRRRLLIRFPHFAAIAFVLISLPPFLLLSIWGLTRSIGCGILLFMEVWKPVVRCPSYEVSSLGRIRNGTTKRVRKVTHTRRGYLGLALSGGNYKYVYIAIHRAVLEAFRGPCPEGHESSHDNDARTDNRLSNLHWKTKKFNGSGEKNPSSRLTWETVRAIRARYCRGVSGRGIKPTADKFKIGMAHAKDIVNHRLWKE